MNPQHVARLLFLAWLVLPQWPARGEEFMVAAEKASAELETVQELTGEMLEAVAALKRSEQAKNGTLLDFERLVCEINGGFSPLRERCLLRERVRLGDFDAAQKPALSSSNG